MIQAKRKNCDLLIELMLIILACLPQVYDLVRITIWIFMVSIAGFTLAQVVKYKFWTNKAIILWWLYIVLVSIEIIYSPNKVVACGHVLKLILLTLSLSYFSKSFNTETVFKVLEIFVGLSVLSVIGDLVFPSFLRNLRSVLIRSADIIHNIDANIAARSPKYGMFPDTAIAAFFCACGMAIGCSYVIRGSKKKGIAWLLVSAFALILTNKRGPMLAAAGALVITLFIKASASRKKKIKIFLALVAVALIALYLFNTNPYLVEWLERINSNHVANKRRINMYGTLFNNFIMHPWTGSGTRSSFIVLDGYDSHNIYLGALSENGIPGLVMLLLVLVMSLLDTLKRLRYFKSHASKVNEAFCVYSIFMQIYIAAYGMTGNPLSNLYSTAMLFLCIGLPIRQYRLETELIMTDQKKIGVLTFVNAYNMGAVLQAYALSSFLNQLKDKDYELIDYECQGIQNQYKFPKLSVVLHNPKYALSKVLSSVFFHKRYRLISEFAHSLPLSKPCDESNYLQVMNQYQTVIVGSDQVWNPAIIKDDLAFFLKDVTCKKASYAASFGLFSLEDQYVATYKPLLQEFDKLSVREESAKKMLESWGLADVRVSCDPVFLLKKEQWETFAEEPTNRKKPYIFLYKINTSRTMIRYAQQLAKDMDCELVCMLNDVRMMKGAKMIYGVSPREWLGLIKNAAYIVTNSFHASAFSIIYQKQFAIEVLKINNANNRVIQLLSVFGLGNRVLDEKGELNNSTIDYTGFDKKMDDCSQASIAYLKSIVEDVI